MDKVPFLIAFPGKRIERNQLGIFCLAPDADIEGGHGRFIIWEILTVVVVAGLLVTIMANATPILDLSPASGREGDTVTVTGSSFDVVGVEFAQATIKFNGNVVKSNVLLNGNGFTTSFIIPSNTPPGTYTVQAIGPRDSAEATFTVMENANVLNAAPVMYAQPLAVAPPAMRATPVTFSHPLAVATPARTSPVLDLSPASGKEGDTVTVTGGSFDVVGVEFAQATIKFNGNVIKSNVLLNGNGFTTSFIIPSNTPPGTYTVQAIGPKDPAEATFTVMEMQVEPFPLWPMIGLFGIAAGAIVIRHHTRSPAIKAPLKQKFPKPPVHIDIQSGVECSSGVDCEDTKLTDISVDIRSGIWKEGGER